MEDTELNNNLSFLRIQQSKRNMWQVKKLNYAEIIFRCCFRLLQLSGGGEQKTRSSILSADREEEPDEADQGWLVQGATQ